MKRKKRKKYSLGTGGGGLNTTYAKPKVKYDIEENAFRDWFLENGQLLGAGLGTLVGGLGKMANQRSSNKITTQEDSEIEETPIVEPSVEGLGEMLIAAFGGTVPKNVPVEVEGDEVAETPSGKMIDFKGPSHEQGGIDVDLPEGTEIFSKRIKVKGKTMAERKKEREKKVMTLEKLLAKNKTDGVLKNSLKRTKENNAKEEARDQELQDMIANMKQQIAEYAYGTGKNGVRKKHATGNTVSSPVENDWLTMLDNMQKNGMFENDFWELKNKGGSGNTNTGGSGIFKNIKDYLGDSPITAGDLTGLAGTMYSAFRPMMNTKENRAGDTPNINAFENYGKNTLETMEQSKDYISGQKDKALRDAEDQRVGATNRNRNTARGVNTMRSLDLASQVAANQADSDIYDNFSRQMMQALSTQAGFESQQDQVVMGGEQARDLADRQDRDAYYSNLARDISSKGEGIQTMGKMFNQRRRNIVSEEAINNSSLNFKFQKDGTLTDKNGTPIDKDKLAELRIKAKEEGFKNIADYLNSLIDG